MLLLLAKAATLFSLLLFIPAFITAVMILKEYKIQNIRFAKYFKFLLLQGFIHSILLVLALFLADFKAAFLIHSFAMLPLYALIVFRSYHLKNIRQERIAAQKIQMPKNPAAQRKIDPKVLKSLRLVGVQKSRWH